MNFGLSKVIRYIRIYGLIRTVVKVAGRMRTGIPIWPVLILLKPIRSSQSVGIIGCGQFAFSSIAFYLTTSTKCKIRWCTDIQEKNAKSLAQAYGIKRHGVDCTQFLENTDLVYIVSNHASHTAYAIQCLEAGCDVYIEKPISTTYEQFKKLRIVVKRTHKNIYIGYNRPHSASVNLIKKYITNGNLPFTLSCFITGHLIPDNHWYRDPNEGTRVCGNLGHWIDLFINFLFLSSVFNCKLNIKISYNNLETQSDNFCVVITTDRGDLTTLTFSVHDEPFEGVNESINFQQGNVIAKINDHRQTQLWIGQKYICKRHWPKNVGHRSSILQPFRINQNRKWSELIVSTELILQITDMVKNSETDRYYEINQNSENQ